MLHTKDALERDAKVEPVMMTPSFVWIALKIQIALKLPTVSIRSAPNAPSLPTATPATVQQGTARNAVKTANATPIIAAMVFVRAVHPRVIVLRTTAASTTFAIRMRSLLTGSTSLSEL